ncbi:MAG: cell division protein ZipA C-terminal FtsZ-binding domain-containing protein, partial [Burkholderiales bacterium]
MSELQLSLIVIGALVVVGVLLYNKAQERAARVRVERALRSEHADVLMDAPAAPSDAAGKVMESRQRPLGQRDAGATPDPSLDYLIELRSASGPIGVEFQEQWAAVAPRVRSRALVAQLHDGGWVAGLQLVSRAGVAGEADLIEFRSEVETLAARLGLQASAPEMKLALESARALDAFCAERDIQVALHVVARAAEGFDRQAVIAIGDRFGTHLGGNGSLVAADGSGRELFSVGDRSGARLDVTGAVASPLLALSLTLDVPRAPETQRTFESMARMAASIAGELDGSIVDDNDKLLDERA